MKAILVKLKTFGFFSTRLPEGSSSVPSYPLPPPTTLVGALAKQLLRVRGMWDEVVFQGKKGKTSPASILVKEGIVLWACAGIPAPVAFPYDEMMRVQKGIYMSSEQLTAPYDLTRDGKPGTASFAYYFSAIAFGATAIPPGFPMYALYLVRDKWVDELVAAAWSIDRVGSKESAAVVEDVEVSGVELDEVRELQLLFYTERSAVKWEKLWPAYSLAYVPMPPLRALVRGSQDLVDFIVPHEGRFYGGTIQLSFVEKVEVLRAAGHILLVPEALLREVRT